VDDDAAHPIPLTNSGATSKTIPIEGTTLLVAYNAECMAQGPDGSYVSITILIDGVPAAPDTGSGSAFCSAGGADTHTYTMVVRNGVAQNVVGGKHPFQMIGTGVSTTSWQLRNMMLSVIGF